MSLKSIAPEQSYILQTVHRLALVLLALLCTALLGSALSLTTPSLPSSYSSSSPHTPYDAGATDLLRFGLFVCALLWLSSLYGVAARRFPSISFPIVQLPLDAATLLFTFIAGTALAGKLHVVDCGQILVWEEHSNLTVTQTGETKNVTDKTWTLNTDKYPFLDYGYVALQAADPVRRCRTLQAADVFMWFAFVAWAIAAWLSFKVWRKERGIGYGGLGGSGFGGSGFGGGMSEKLGGMSEKLGGMRWGRRRGEDGLGAGKSMVSGVSSYTGVTGISSTDYTGSEV